MFFLNNCFFPFSVYYLVFHIAYKMLHDHWPCKQCNTSLAHKTSMLVGENLLMWAREICIVGVTVTHLNNYILLPHSCCLSCTKRADGQAVKLLQSKYLISCRVIWYRNRSEPFKKSTLKKVDLWDDIWLLNNFACRKCGCKVATNINCGNVVCCAAVK